MVSCGVTAVNEAAGMVTPVAAEVAVTATPPGLVPEACTVLAKLVMAG